MKRIVIYVKSLLLVIVIIGNSSAQNAESYPRQLKDPTLLERLESDLTFRNSQVVDHPVTWWDTGYGYYGAYSIGGEYMTWYDEDGNYIGTLEKKNWNDTDVPASIRSSYDKSLFRSSSVTSYWQVTDPQKQGYFFELKNDSGKVSRVWANGNGKFSSRP